MSEGAYTHQKEQVQSNAMEDTMSSRRLPKLDPRDSSTPRESSALGPSHFARPLQATSRSENGLQSQRGQAPFMRGRVKRKRRSPTPLASGIVPLAAHERPLYDRNAVTTAIIDSNTNAVRQSNARRQLMPAIPVRRDSANQVKTLGKSSSSGSSTPKSTVQGLGIQATGQPFSTTALSEAFAQRAKEVVADAGKEDGPSGQGLEASHGSALTRHLDIPHSRGNQTIMSPNRNGKFDPRLSVVSSHAPSESDYGDAISIAEGSRSPSQRDSTYGGAVITPLLNQSGMMGPDPRASMASFRWSQGEWADYAAQLSAHISIGGANDAGTPIIPEETRTLPTSSSNVSSESRHQMADGQRFSIINKAPATEREQGPLLAAISDAVSSRSLTDEPAASTSSHGDASHWHKSSEADNPQLGSKNLASGQDRSRKLDPTPLLAQVAQTLSNTNSIPAESADSEHVQTSASPSSPMNDSSGSDEARGSLSQRRKTRPSNLNLNEISTSPGVSRSSSIVRCLASPSLALRTPPPTNPPTEPLPPLPDDAFASIQKGSISSDIASQALSPKRESTGSSAGAHAAAQPDGGKRLSTMSASSQGNRRGKTTSSLTHSDGVHPGSTAKPTDHSSSSAGTLQNDSSKAPSSGQSLPVKISSDGTVLPHVNAEPVRESALTISTSTSNDIDGKEDSSFAEYDAEEAVITSVTGTRNSALGTPTLMRPESAQFFTKHMKAKDGQANNDTRMKVESMPVNHESARILSPLQSAVTNQQHWQRTNGTRLGADSSAQDKAKIEGALKPPHDTSTENTSDWRKSDEVSSVGHQAPSRFGQTIDTGELDNSKDSADMRSTSQRADSLNGGTFADILSAFKQLQAEKRVLEKIIRATTPLDGLSNHENLAEYLIAMPAKLEASTQEIYKLLELLDRQKSVMDYMVDTHHLEIEAQLEEMELLRRDLDDAEDEAETHRSNAIHLTEQLDQARESLLATQEQAVKQQANFQERLQRQLAVTRAQSGTIHTSSSDANESESRSDETNANDADFSRIAKLEQEIANLKITNANLEQKLQGSPGHEKSMRYADSVSLPSPRTLSEGDDSEKEAMQNKILQQEKDISDLRAQIALGTSSVGASTEEESPLESPTRRTMASIATDRGEQVRALMVQMSEQRTREAQIRTAYRHVRDELRKMQNAQSQERKKTPASMSLLSARPTTPGSLQPSPNSISDAHSPGTNSSGTESAFASEVNKINNGTTSRQLKRLSLPMNGQFGSNPLSTDSGATSDNHSLKSAAKDLVTPRARASQGKRSSWRYSVDFASAASALGHATTARDASPVFAGRMSAFESGSAREAAQGALSYHSAAAGNGFASRFQTSRERLGNKGSTSESGHR